MCMGRKLISSIIVLFFVGNLLFTSLVGFVAYLNTSKINYNTSSAVMLNLSKVKNVTKSFVDVCSNVGNMLSEYTKNDKTEPVINQKENDNNSTSAVILSDKIIVSSLQQYKYNLYEQGKLKLYSLTKEHIVDKPDRTSNIFLLLLLQMLLFLIVLNMCKYYNVFYLYTNRITPSLLTV